MNQLLVTVNDDLTLDAGTWELQEHSGAVCRVVHPPARLMYEQILDYLERQPAPTSRLTPGEEAVVAVAVCLRWGTYFAVLADQTKPMIQLPEDTSRISDSEMARINIEASAALEMWIDVMRQDNRRYHVLAAKAHLYLPLTRKSVARSSDISAVFLRSLAFPISASLLGGNKSLAAVVSAHPTRVLANTFINTCWRNTENVENAHAGVSPSSYPLARCWITKSEERAIVREAAEGFLELVHAVPAFRISGRSWEKQVFPYTTPFIYPAEWAIDESTRKIVLCGQEGKASDVEVG